MEDGPETRRLIITPPVPHARGSGRSAQFAELFEVPKSVPTIKLATNGDLGTLDEKVVVEGCEVEGCLKSKTLISYVADTCV